MKLTVIVYETGKEMKSDGYSGQELAALQEAVEGLWDTYVDLVDTEDGGFELVGDVPETEIAKMLKQSKYRIRPRQFGLSPWPDLVEVSFRVAENGSVPAQTTASTQTE